MIRLALCTSFVCIAAALPDFCQLVSPAFCVGNTHSFVEITDSDTFLNTHPLPYVSMPDLGDIDGDGDFDMVSCDNDGNIDFYKNIGAPSSPHFAKRSGQDNPFDAIDGGSRCMVRLVDLNFDGLLDLVVGAHSLMHLYLNSGNATHPSFNTTSPNTDIMKYSVYGRNFPVFVDINGDSKPDIFLGDRCETMQYYINNSTASVVSFQTSTITSIIDTMVSGSTAGECIPAFIDIDHDGDMDMLITSYHGPTFFYLNHGSAVFPNFVRMPGLANPFDDLVPSSTGLVARFIDLDNDGDEDALLAANFYSRFRYFENRSPRHQYIVTQSEENPLYGANTRQASKPTAIKRGNLIDVLVMDNFYAGNNEVYDHIFHYYLNNGTSKLPQYADMTSSSTFAQFSISPLPLSSIVVADMNGDHYDDLLVSSMWGLLVMYFEPNNATYLWPSSILRSHHFDYSSYAKPVLIDLDADGDLDLSYGFKYYSNRGSASSPNWFSVAGAAIESDSGTTTFADIDGDGDFDMLSSDWFGKLLYRENVGSATSPHFLRRNGTKNPFAAAEDVDDYGKDARAAFGDIDNDGDADLLVIYYGRSVFEYWENVGNATMANYTIHPHGTADNPFNDIVRGMPQFCDVDGDGRLDLIVGHDNGNIVYYHNENAEFSLVSGAGNPFEMIYVGDRASPACGDVDNDGDLDYVVTSLVTYNIYVFENCGNATSPLLVRSVCDMEVNLMSDRIAPYITGGDLNNDGLMDLVLGHDDGNLYICMHVGNSTHLVYSQIPHASSPLNGFTYSRPSPSLFDMDGDGDLDIVVGDADGRLHLLTNIGSEVSAVFDNAQNPFEGIDVGSYASPAVFDIDDDGDIDVLVGEQSGEITFLSSGRCTPPLGKQCTGNGACLSNRLFPSCTCFSGFSADQCNSCQYGFYGSSCSVCPGGNDKTYLTLSNICTRNGICDWGFGGTGECKCTAPFYGNECEHGVCPRGHERRFSDSLATFVCSPCAVGFYNNEEGGECTLCEDAKTTITEGSTFCDYCDAGYYSETTTRTCLPCVSGMLCTSDYIPVELEKVHLTKDKYRSRQESATLYDCPRSTCIGGNGTGNDLCAGGSYGPLCGVCKSGYYYNSVNDKCAKCGNYTTSASIAVTIVFGVLFIVVLLCMWRCVIGKQSSVNRVAHLAQMFILQRLVSAHLDDDDVVSRDIQSHKSNMVTLNENFEPVPQPRYSRTSSHLVSADPSDKAENLTTEQAPSQEEEDSMRFRSVQEKCKIVLTLYQIVTSFPWTLGINYPFIYRWLLNIFSFINLDLIHVVPIGCMFPSNFFTQLLVTTVSPLVICLFIYLLSLVGRVKTRLRLENGKHTNFQIELGVRRSDSRYFQLFLIWTFFVFPSVSTKIFRGLRSCHKLDDGKSYMRDDYSIECSSVTYRNVLILSYFMLFIYVIGIPLMYFCLLYTHRHKIVKEGTKRRIELSKIEKEELGSMDDATKKLEISRLRWRYKWSDDIAPLGFLFMAYEPALWWWEVLECVRRLLFTGLMVFFLPETPAQIMIGILIAVCSGLVYAHYGPYVDDGDDTVNNWSQLSIFLVLFASLALKIDIAGDTPQSQLIFGVVLVIVVLSTPVIMIYLVLLDVEELITWDDVKKYMRKCFRLKSKRADQVVPLEKNEVDDIEGNRAKGQRG